MCSSDYDQTKHILVGDFGLSRNFEHEQEMSTFCGSPEYTAPEILNMHPYGKEVDLWSVGVISYIMLTGFLPFYEKNATLLFDKIKSADYNWEGCPDVSNDAKDFVAKLLTVDPKQRMTAADALQHAWLVPKKNSPSQLRAQPPTTTTKTKYQRKNTSSSEKVTELLKKNAEQKEQQHEQANAPSQTPSSENHQLSTSFSDTTNSSTKSKNKKKGKGCNLI